MKAQVVINFCHSMFSSMPIYDNCLRRRKALTNSVKQTKNSEIGLELTLALDINKWNFDGIQMKLD